MLQFFDGVHAAGLQQFSKLRTYAIDAIQVAVVRPLQNQLAADAGLLLQCLTACGLCTFLQQFCIGLNTCCNQFLGVNFTYTLNVNYFVSHIIKSFSYFMLQ